MFVRFFLSKYFVLLTDVCSFQIVNSELLVETNQTVIDPENALMLEFGCKETSAHCKSVITYH